MKTTTSKHIRLGLFISVGVAVFTLGIFFIGGEQQLFRSTFRISGVFKDVGGLQAGNNVRLSGINVGTVDNIMIVSDTSIRVEILIEERIRQFIMRDAVATIGSEGLMGNKVLIINPGTGGEIGIKDNDVVETVQPMSMDDILVSLKETIDNTTSMTSDLSKITDNIQSGRGTVGRLLMDRSLRQDFDSTFANLKNGSVGFRLLVEKANSMDTILTSLGAVINNTSNITGDLATITGSIQSGKGTMGRLLMDPALGATLDSTLVNLKEGSAELKLLLEIAKDSWLLWSF